MRIENKIRKLAMAVLVAGSLVVIQPISDVPFVQAVVYEDCDLDGYDDATGAVMPWIGFDGTKGDTVPGDWDGKTTYKSYKDYLNSTQKEETEEGNSSANTTAGGGSSNSSSSTASGTQKNTSSASSSTSSAKQNSSSGTAGSQGKSSGSSRTAGNSSSSKQKQSSSSNSSSTGKKNQTSNNNSSSSAEKKQPKDNSSSLAAEKPSTENTAGKQKKKKTAANPAVESQEKADDTTDSTQDTAMLDDPVTEEVTTLSDDAEVIFTTAGQLEVSETDGSVIHAGSDVLIVGSNFATNASGFTIEIHSDHPVPLANVDTAEDGSFEVEAYLPDDLPEGPHDIVLLYQGQEIASRHIEVGAKAADSFLAAATAGFSSDNQGLVPGLLILTGLFVLGIVVTLLGGRTQRRI